MPAAKDEMIQKQDAHLLQDIKVSYTSFQTS